MKRIVGIFLGALLAIWSPDADAVRLKSGPSLGPTFPACVGTPASATKVGSGATISYLGSNWVAQNPVNVALNGTVFSSPICGGVWRDNGDPNTIYFNNFAQEYAAFDQARQTRSEIAPATGGVTFGANTTYHDIFQIYVDSLTNVVGVEFTTLSQTHGADSKYGLDIPPNPSNTINGSPVSAVAVFSTNFSQASPGANLQVFSQVAWGQNVQNRGVFNGNPAAQITGTPASLGAFNVWHTIDKTENDGHGFGGRFLLTIDGVQLTNYVGNTGYQFVDLLHTHGQALNSFTGSIAGTALAVPGTVTGTPIAIGQYVNGLLGEVQPDTLITGGSGIAWTVNNSQTVVATTMATTAAQSVNSYQKIGQYWGMFACNSTGAEPWCHYPPVGTRFISARKGEFQVFLNYSAISNSGNSVGTATSGVPYSQSLVLTRGSTSTGTPVYGVSGSVPGLSLGPSTGIYSGTPTTPGSYVVTFTVTDDQGTTDSLPITITVS